MTIQLNKTLRTKKISRYKMSRRMKKYGSYSIIITASFIPSHPSIETIKRAIKSLKYTNMDKDTPIILAHDYNADSKYTEYLKNLKTYISDKQNIKLVVTDSARHLTGSVRNAFNFINTDFVLIMQHDLPFIRSFEIEKAIEDMKNNPEIKHIRFNKRANINHPRDAFNELFGYQNKSINYTYTRTPQWSDQNHICLSSYYRNLILKECNDGTYISKCVDRKSTTAKIHKKYGTYIFGPINEPAFIYHTDGAGRYPHRKRPDPLSTIDSVL